MTRKKEVQRYRCCVVGCNPKLFGQQAAEQHAEQTGHRTAKWPVRSPEGRRKQRERNRAQFEQANDYRRHDDFVVGFGEDNL